jgi:hypothetical protein
MDPASHDGRSEPARKVEVRSVDIAFLDGDRTLAVHDDAACERLACNGRAQEAEHEKLQIAGGGGGSARASTISL